MKCIILKLKLSNNNLCDSIVKPDVNSYNAVIEAWAFHRSRQQNVVRAERWFHRISEPKGNSPSKYRSSAIKDINLSTKTDSELSLTPNLESYNLLLAALSRGLGNSASMRESHASRASALLHEMKSSSIQPNTDSYNYVMQSWVRCGRDKFVAEKVMQILREMEASKIPANTISYTIAMNSWSASAELKARSQRRLAKNVRESKESTYASDIERVEKILHYMHDLHDAGIPDVCPDNHAYNTLIAGT